MLNRINIPTKLAGGFSVILFLLILVAAGAYWGIRSLDVCTEEIVATEDIQTEMMALRRELLQAQIAALKGVYHRKTEYEAIRGKHDVEIKRIADSIRSELKEANRKDLEECEEIYRRYCEGDTRWYEKEAERAKAAVQLVQVSENALQALDRCRTTFVASMSAALGPENRFGFIEQDGRPYYLARRVGQLEKIDGFKFRMQTLRREYFELFSTTDIPTRLEILSRITDHRVHFAEDVQAFHDDMTTDTSRNAIRQVLDAFQAWEENFDCVIEAMKTQDLCTAQQDKDAAAMEELMTTIIGRLEERVRGIRDRAETVEYGVDAALVAVTGLALFFGFTISIGLSRNITVGLKRTLETVNKIVGDGDLSVDIAEDLLQRRDEIGDLAQGAHRVAADYHAIGEMAMKLAEGDWRVEIKEKSDVDVMNRALAGMIAQINSALHEILGDVAEVQRGAAEVNTAAETLSAGAQSSASSLEEITASMTEISAQTTANAEHVKEANELATRTTEAASEGQTAMREMNAAMDRITKNSGEIRRVVKVIDDIAFQTNLLALNAAVEAARAGAHGKGFAVVADEVRKLAARSAEAAQETTDLISTSGREIERGAEVSTKTAEMLNTIVEQIGRTTGLIGSIAIATNEQAQGVAQISLGLQQIDAVTQQNTSAAEECAAAAAEMNGMASGLQELVSRFRLHS